MTDKRVRILVGKPGLDGHDRGVKTVCLALRDAGFEVIYTGLHKTPDQIVHTALQEDVDAVGLSILSGAHVPISKEVKQKMRDAGIGDTLLLVGGVIPERDVPVLLAAGVDGVFPVASPYEAIVAFIKEKLHV
jgi:methylmalonyl-CoA mutase C-terminal domain/subunit